MSTRAKIGRLLDDGRIESIYNHSDGYINGGVGDMLDEHYRDPAKIDALFKLGDLSYLGREPKSDPRLWTKKWDEVIPELDGYSRSYADRGEKIVPHFYDNEESYFADDDGTDFKYLFKNGKLYAKKYDTNEIQELKKFLPQGRVFADKTRRFKSPLALAKALK